MLSEDRKPRCLILFEGSFRSEATGKTYTKLLDYFLTFSKKDHESLLLLSDKEIQVLLEDYMLYIKRRYKRASAKTIIAAIAKFLIINDKTVNLKKLQMFLPEEEKPGGEKAITTIQVRKMLDYATTIRLKTIIHIFASCGARPEGLSLLQIKDLEDMPDGCKSLLIYADSPHEYFTFLTPEANSVLDEYLQSRRKRGEKLAPESYVIGRETFIVNEKRPKPVMINSLESSLSHAMRRAGISRIKKGNRYDIAVCGSFRKRFNTILKKNPNISFTTAEIMMDHSVRQEPSYNKPTKQELFEEYKKALPELTIDDSERLKAKNAKLEKEKNESVANRELIDDLQTQLVQVQFELKAVTTSVQTKYDDELQQRKEKLGIA